MECGYWGRCSKKANPRLEAMGPCLAHQDSVFLASLSMSFSTCNLFFLPLFLHFCLLCWDTEDLLCTVPQHLHDLSFRSHLHSSTNLTTEELKSVRTCLGPTVYSTALLLFPAPMSKACSDSQKGGALLVNSHVTFSWDFTSCGFCEAAGSV